MLIWWPAAVECLRVEAVVYCSWCGITDYSKQRSHTGQKKKTRFWLTTGGLFPRWEKKKRQGRAQSKPKTYRWQIHSCALKPPILARSWVVRHKDKEHPRAVNWRALRLRNRLPLSVLGEPGVFHARLTFVKTCHSRILKFSGAPTCTAMFSNVSVCSSS